MRNPLRHRDNLHFGACSLASYERTLGEFKTDGGQRCLAKRSAGGRRMPAMVGINACFRPEARMLSG
jgi:hypothetical protein